MRNTYEEHPLFLLTDCLRKAKTVKSLCDATGIHETTVYGWLGFRHGISDDSYAILSAYRRDLLKKPSEPPKENKLTWSRKESGLTLPSIDTTARIIKHGIGKDDTPYVFARTVQDETVFIPRFVAYEIVKQMEYIKVNDVINVRVVKDLSNRSDYVAKKFLGSAEV